MAVSLFGARDELWLELNRDLIIIKTSLSRSQKEKTSSIKTASKFPTKILEVPKLSTSHHNSGGKDLKNPEDPENFNKSSQIRTLNQEILDQEKLRQGTLNQEILKQGTLNQEILDQEILRQGTLNQEILNQGTLEQEILNQEIPKQGTLNQELLKQGTLNQETPNQ
ncbi:hypothetical protein KM043_001272 [Ampulex compressa]|nr:hypothetical protein KM043_001272 [Ampulex compressa]